MATAVITGTITSSTREADIVAGGKTIIITLTGDTWIINRSSTYFKDDGSTTWADDGTTTWQDDV